MKASSKDQFPGPTTVPMDPRKLHRCPCNPMPSQMYLRSGLASRARLAIVRRCRQKEFVLEVGRQCADGFGTERVGGILTAAGRSTIMGLVEDENIVSAWVDRFAFGGECLFEQAQRTLALKKVDR